jgi:hypothetical protein
MATMLRAEKLSQFLDELALGQADRRREPRIPFARQVTLYFDDSPIPLQVSVRDISASGIGLLHEFSIGTGEATVRISLESGTMLCARVQILCCKEAGLGCYLSSGKFLSVYDDDPIDSQFPGRVSL